MFVGLFSSGLDARWFIDTDHLRTEHRNVCVQEQNANALQLRLTGAGVGMVSIRLPSLYITVRTRRSWLTFPRRNLFATLTTRQKRTGGYLTERLTRDSDMRNGEEASGGGGAACFRNGKGSHPVEVCFLSLCQPFRSNCWWLEYKRARLVVLLVMFLLFLDFHHHHLSPL